MKRELPASAEEDHHVSTAGGRAEVIEDARPEASIRLAGALKGDRAMMADWGQPPQTRTGAVAVR